MGYKCDQCQVNYYYDQERAQCQECPVCYSLVQDEVRALPPSLTLPSLGPGP